MGSMPAIEDLNTPRHFTRSSVKPRLLFPHATRPRGKTGDTTDEEAVTDIEYPHEHQEKEPQAKDVVTPAKKRYYATPPTTVRATRTMSKHVSLPSSPAEGDTTVKSPFTVRRATRTSPNEKLQRSRPGTTAGVGASPVGQDTRKRDAVSPVADAQGGSKRQKT